ncbi:MAG: glucosamine-6-phosphate deaminase [Acidobacteriia bacterium]|nr:glucosamine-6-phosphate deaminase [Terriglobia bacterium]
MNIKVYDDKASLGRAAAHQAAEAIGRAIQKNGRARIIAATGASQFELLDSLTRLPGISWERVELFHLDEYIGLSATHPASFRNYLLTRLINKVGITHYHLLDGEQKTAEVIRNVGNALQKAPIDVALVGIGENGHLAFNDPPADFETEEPYIVVTLDEACRKQQLGEGWFANLSEVPRRAISMSVRQILRAREIICAVSDARKARAVAACLEGEISPLAPASILRTHPNTTIYLDRSAAALLSQTPA